MRLRITFVLAVVLTLLVPPNAAVAADPPAPQQLTWKLTFDPPRPQTSSAAPAAQHPRAAVPSEQAEDDDLKHECAKHPQAQTDQGWPADRFDQCFLRTDAHLTLQDSVTQAPLGRIDFSSSLLVFAYDGERKIDYFFTFDDYKLDYADFPEAAPYYESTALTVSFAGCGALVICSQTPASRTELAPAWQIAPSRSYQFSVTSDNDAGTGTLKILYSLISMNLSAVTAFGRVTPFEQTLAFSRGRFDSAGSAGAGKFWGAVIPDFVPTLVLDRSATSTYRAEAIHVDDALHHPVRTFPSFAGKSVPGEGNRPLHRLMDQSKRTANNNASRAICQKYWGSDYAAGGLECDEYPFQSTYEGSSVSTGGDTSQWNGSARPIDGTQNGKGGNHLQAFYGQNRLLDETLGTDNIGPTDPFYVRITG